MKDVKKILIILADEHIGDTIFALAAVRSIREAFPKAKIDILINTISMGVVEDDSVVDNIIPIHPWWEEFWHKNKFYSYQGSLFLKRFILYFIPFFITLFDKTLKDLREKKYDLAINFYGSLHTNYLTFLTGARERVGFGEGISKIFLTKVVPSDSKVKHRIERCLDIAIFLGGKIKNTEIYLSKEHEIFARKIMKIISKNKKIIAIHPGVSKIGEARKISVGKWIELINSLENDFAILILGATTEMDIVDEILFSIKNKNNILNLVDKTNIKEMAALIKRCDLLIGLESGACHIAAAVGTPVIAFWGEKTDPRVWGPFIKRKVIIRKENINDIKEILAAVKRLIKN